LPLATRSCPCSSLSFCGTPLRESSTIFDLSVVPVYSVIVAHSRGHVPDVEEIALDPAAETSGNLLRCLLVEVQLRSARVSVARTLSVARTFDCCRQINSCTLRASYHWRSSYPLRKKKWQVNVIYGISAEQWNKVVLFHSYTRCVIRHEVRDFKSVAKTPARINERRTIANLDKLIEEVVATKNAG